MTHIPNMYFHSLFHTGCTSRADSAKKQRWVCRTGAAHVHCAFTQRFLLLQIQMSIVHSAMFFRCSHPTTVCHVLWFMIYIVYIIKVILKLRYTSNHLNSPLNFWQKLQAMMRFRVFYFFFFPVLNVIWWLWNTEHLTRQHCWFCSAPATRNALIC